jgi:hypothetical protein
VDIPVAEWIPVIAVLGVVVPSWLHLYLKINELTTTVMRRRLHQEIRIVQLKKLLLENNIEIPNPPDDRLPR